MDDITLESSLTNALGSATVMLVLISMAGIVGGGGSNLEEEVSKQIRDVCVFMQELPVDGHEFSASRVPGPLSETHRLSNWPAWERPLSW